MLASSKMIGFVPTRDSKQAREFYEGKLGFRFVSDDPFALVMMAGDTMIRIAKAKDFTPAPYTVMGWEANDIESAGPLAHRPRRCFRKIPIHSGPGAGHLGRSRRRQSRLVQGS